MMVRTLKLGARRRINFSSGARKHITNMNLYHWKRNKASSDGFTQNRLGDDTCSILTDPNFRWDSKVDLKVEMKINGEPSFIGELTGHVVGLVEQSEDKTLYLAPTTLKILYKESIDRFHKNPSIYAFENQFRGVPVSKIVSYRFG